MKFAAVYRTFLRAGPAVMATASAVGTWLRLYAHAAEIEEWGVIPGCKSWPSRAWMATAMVTPEELEEAIAAGLCNWRGDDLVVLGYDVDGQKTVEKLRENGGKGGRPKKTKPEPDRNQADNQQGNQVGNPSSFPSSSFPSSSSLTQPLGGGGETGSPDDDLDNGSEPDASGQAEVSPVAEVFKRLHPIARQILGKSVSFNRGHRRELGMIIADARRDGRGQQIIEGIPRWYARFLRDTDHRYIERGHDFSLFLRDINAFTTPTERTIQGHVMNERFPWGLFLIRVSPVLFDAVTAGMDPDGDEFGYVEQRLLAAFRIHMPGAKKINEDQLRAVAEKLAGVTCAVNGVTALPAVSP